MTLNLRTFVLQIRAQSYTLVLVQTLSNKNDSTSPYFPHNSTFFLLSEGIHLSYKRDCGVNILFPVRNDY
jgi:hypothetical protein